VTMARMRQSKRLINLVRSSFHAEREISGPKIKLDMIFVLCIIIACRSRLQFDALNAAFSQLTESLAMRQAARMLILAGVHCAKNGLRRASASNADILLTKVTPVVQISPTMQKKSNWMDQGVMKRKDAILLGRYWTGLRYAIRIEPLGHRDHVHVYLKIGPKA
jgi:hypothetical protein